MKNYHRALDLIHFIVFWEVNLFPKGWSVFLKYKWLKVGEETIPSQDSVSDDM